MKEFQAYIKDILLIYADRFRNKDYFFYCMKFFNKNRKLTTDNFNLKIIFKM